MMQSVGKISSPQLRPGCCINVSHGLGSFIRWDEALISTERRFTMLRQMNANCLVVAIRATDDQHSFKNAAQARVLMPDGGLWWINLQKNKLEFVSSSEAS